MNVKLVILAWACVSGTAGLAATTNHLAQSTPATPSNATVRIRAPAAPGTPTNAPAHRNSGRSRRKGPTIQETAALQTALDRNGFGVGLIDGQAGVRTVQALHDYALSNDESDTAARRELQDDAEPATASYTITSEDLSKVGSAPLDYEEASEVPAMACTNLADVLLEKFHVSKPFLARLNPEIADWSAVAAGTEVVVPNSRGAEWTAEASRLEVDCTAYRIRAYNADNVLIASFPCSIAKKLKKVPVGDLKLVAFAPHPNYTFDPDNFPESQRAQEIGRKLIIPPGPRNPVGVYWLSLNAPGFGMHGTPHPETIGRRESHGCFRLTNWDVTTLATMVQAGTPVRVMNVPVEATE